MNKIVYILFVLITTSVQAQVLEDTSIFKYPIGMDEVTIKASRTGWDVKGFIKRVQNDTTFYKAFKTSRLMSYKAVNDIKVYNKKGKVQASLHSNTKQNRIGNCRTMDVLNEEVKGDFYKRNGEYRYYTAELYAYLFFTKGKVCDENDNVGDMLEYDGGGQKEKNLFQLKQLVFNPGSKVAGVPLMGERAAIFEPDIAKMYDFKLLSETYNGEDCYVFKAIPKPEYQNKVVYNNLATWFRKSDYSIVARDYSLSYKTLVYDFDVRMKVRTQQVNGKLVPTRIEYDGNWHVFTQKRERVKFTQTITY